MTIGQLVLPAAVAVLAGLLLLRVAISVPGWVRQARRPETRSILVVGVGGGGGNAVERMVAARIPAVRFAACNTDAQALRRSSAGTRLRIGDPITHGLGSGGDPEVGRKAAEQDKERIDSAVAGSDLVFVTAGLGGGTGSGAAPTVAASAKARGALTIAVVTMPFAFEGVERQRIAEVAASELAASADAMIVVDNDRVGDVLAQDASVGDAFRAVDDVLLWAVRGIIDLTRTPGLINLDFADVRAVLENAGPAMIGVGRGSGSDRATEAARLAVSSPLLATSIRGARSLLFNVSGASDLRLAEVRRAAEEIRAEADPAARVIFGTTIDPAFGEDVVITLIAAGLAARAEASPGVSPAPGVAPAPRVAAVPMASAPGVALPPGTVPAPAPASRATAPGPASSSPSPEATAPEGSSGAEAPEAPVIGRRARGRRREHLADAPVDEAPPMPTTPMPPPAVPSALDLNDLEVPSFLRRRRRQG